jgi:putative isomerase
MFVVDLLSIFPDTDAVIREIFQNYWDFQVRWNALMPQFAHDMIPCMISPDTEKWVSFPAHAQILILAWGLERVYRRNGDRQLVAQALAPLERFHDWYWRERDVADTGLVGLGAYSDNVQHARWETFDYECCLDNLELTPHPKRPGDNRAWYGNICTSGNTAYLILAEKCLATLAAEIGDDALAARRTARAQRATEAMRTHMWDEEVGTFLSVWRDTLAKIPVATIGSWIPLHAGVPTEAMAARMAQVLTTEPWQTPLPIPTVDSTHPEWGSGIFWRGDVWPAPNYQVVDGLAGYGHTDLASEIADKTIDNALVNGIAEHYDSVSGKPLGVDYLGMTCTILTMMLDRHAGKHRFAVKEQTA